MWGRAKSAGKLLPRRRVDTRWEIARSLKQWDHNTTIVLCCQLVNAVCRDNGSTDGIEPTRTYPTPLHAMLHAGHRCACTLAPPRECHIPHALSVASSIASSAAEHGSCLGAKGCIPHGVASPLDNRRSPAITDVQQRLHDDLRLRNSSLHSM